MRLALAQIVSTADPTQNLSIVRDYAKRAASAGAELVVFPEATMCAFGNSLLDVAEPLDGPWAGEVRAIARELEIVIVAGMFTPGTGARVRNTLLVTGPGVETSYDKIHLFDAFGFSESDDVDAGVSPVTFELNGTVFGLATCYDIRFPELFTSNARSGAMVNIVCASWGVGEGKAEQWDLLVRARALDSTTFIVACGQGDPSTVGVEAIGTAPTGMGHSMVASPVGKSLLSLDAGPELAVFDIEPNEVPDVRLKLPVLANARSLSSTAPLPAVTTPH